METLKVGDEVTLVLVCGDKTVLKGVVVSVAIEDLGLTSDAAVGLVGKEKPDYALLGKGADHLVAGRVFQAMQDRSPETGIYVLSDLTKAPPC